MRASSLASSESSSVSSLLVKTILGTFLLMPLWWVLGFLSFIFQASVYMLFVFFLFFLVRTQSGLKIPRPALIMGTFLLSYLVSIGVNFFEYPLQRILASLNNYLVWVMGFLLMLVIYNLEFERIIFPWNKVCLLLSAFTGIFGVCGLGAWLAGYKNLEYPALLTRLYPSLAEYPFFLLFSIIQIVKTESLFAELPRLSFYSGVPTATAGLLMMILPFAAAFHKIEGRQRKFLYYCVVSAAWVTFFFCLSRTAACAFVAAWIFVRFMETRNKIVPALIFMVLTFLCAERVYDGIIWLLQARENSTIGRMNIYSDALRILFNENPLFGVGVRPRNEFTMMATGSHSTYVGLLLITGIAGFFLLISFQLSVFLIWISQQEFLRGKNEKIIWKSLGVSYISASIWFSTDSLDSLPFISYTYFVVVGCILCLARFLRNRARAAAETLGK